MLGDTRGSPWRHAASSSVLRSAAAVTTAPLRGRNEPCSSCPRPEPTAVRCSRPWRAASSPSYGYCAHSCLCMQCRKGARTAARALAGQRATHRSLFLKALGYARAVRAGRIRRQGLRWGWSSRPFRSPHRETFFSCNFLSVKGLEQLSGTVHVSIADVAFCPRIAAPPPLRTGFSTRWSPRHSGNARPRPCY